jgi:hypothetical protein
MMSLSDANTVGGCAGAIDFLPHLLARRVAP